MLDEALSAPVCAVIIPKVEMTAFIWRAMYGVLPVTATIVARAASDLDL